MVDVRVTVDLSKLVDLPTPGEATAKLGGVVREAALFGERTVVGFTPVDTGAAKASITSARVTALEWRIVSPLYYVPLLEDGTRAHVIVPKHKKVLKFKVGAATVFTKIVKHPGTKPYRMFARSIPIITRHLEALIPKVFEK